MSLPPEPVPGRVAARQRCPHCHWVGAIRAEWRPEWHPHTGPTWSDPDNPKMCAHLLWWPWAVCRPGLGGCGTQERFRLVTIG